MKLNLGCGDDVREGYINVDIRKTHPSVQVADLSVFPWPFEADSADEIMMLDFLEHFPYGSTAFILLECFRVVKPEGTVVIQVPDGEILAKALINRGDYQCNRCGTEMEEIFDQRYDHRINKLQCDGCGQWYQEIAEAAMRRLYGGQDFVGNYHQTCFTKESLRHKAKLSGLEFLRLDEEIHQRANWNFKAVFRKSDLWEND